jgi:hypothetical protein
MTTSVDFDVKTIYEYSIITNEERSKVEKLMDKIKGLWGVDNLQCSFSQISPEEAEFEISFESIIPVGGDIGIIKKELGIE